MNRKQRIIVSITGIFTVLLILVGLTYAYFATKVKGNPKKESIIAGTADLVLEYSNGNGVLEAANIIPGEDILFYTRDSNGNIIYDGDLPRLYEYKTFTVANKGDSVIESYKVYFEDVKNEFNLKEDLKYSLECKSYKQDDYSINGENASEVGLCNGIDNATFPSIMSSIISNSIDKDIIHLYKLNINYLDNGNQSIDMGKTIKAKINIYDGNVKFLSSSIIENSLAGLNGTSYVEPKMLGVANNTTMPGKDINNVNEKILSYTFDKYGTSYYFRGNVQDNYVNFADMCWRIVRTEGNGAIKLILEDKDQICNSRDENQVLNMNGDWNIYASDGNELTMDTTKNTPYVNGNFGYDNTFFSKSYGVESYLNPITVSERSTLNAFKYFQKQFSEKELSKLKAGDWCLGNSAYSSGVVDFSSVNPLTQEEKNNYYSKNWNIFYEPYIRLVSNVSTYGENVTNICYSDELNSYIDGTPMFVSALTVDESVFAGAKASSFAVNYNYYLINNYQRNSSLRFWLLSLAAYNPYDSVYTLGNKGDLDFYQVNANHSFRPVISLIPKVQISEGNGTITNPYVIN